MAVTLTEAAAKHVQKFLPRRGKGVGLRLGVKTSGCSGMAYKLEFADEVNSDDQVWESFGVKVIVDEKSLPYLDGTELDYTREGLQEGFKFHNPNEKSLRRVLPRLMDHRGYARKAGPLLGRKSKKRTGRTDDGADESIPAVRHEARLHDRRS